MPRGRILAAAEQEAFDSPPTFTALERKKHFARSETVRSLMDTLQTPTNRVCFLVALAYFRATRQFFAPVLPGGPALRGWTPRGRGRGHRCHSVRQESRPPDPPESTAEYRLQPPSRARQLRNISEDVTHTRKASGPAVRMRLRAGTDGPQFRVFSFENLPPTLSSLPWACWESLPWLP